MSGTVRVVVVDDHPVVVDGVRLLLRDDEAIEVVGSALDGESAVRLVQRNRPHVVLLPYQPRAYAQRSSGILMEALAAGLPTVVTAGSWMQTVLERAPAEAPAGLAASPTPEELAQALLAVAGDWDRFALGARRLGEALRWRRDPEELVRQLGGSDVDPSPADG